MKLIRPIAITSGIVTANTATDAYAAYVAGTTYALGDFVTYSKRSYQSLQATNAGHTPGIAASATWWADVGPANSWAVFDNQVSTQTVAASPWSFTLTGVTADGLALLNINATSVNVTATKDGVTIYNNTVNLLDTSVVTNWAEYFFNAPEFKTELMLTDIPPPPGLVITATVSRTGGGNVSGGLVSCGRVLDAGSEQHGLKREGIDYTKVTFDEFQNVTIGTHRYVRKFSTQAAIDNGKFDAIANRLDSLASTPLVISGGNSLYNSLILYGLLTYSIDLKTPKYSYVTYEAKGLI
ncbi:hypothetical protein ACO0LB_09960 [Undibacterium sp. SXout7W]|uniref:hypothetical protein n=1 Tax=Undibacterium sp. SXout7W TaxID=3413049 RepID=UPI003BF3DDA0